MAETLVMVGTRKGLWIGRSDEARRDWSWTGPHFAMEEVYSCLVDTRGDRPRLLAGASSSWLGPQVWRSDDLGETWQETPNGAVRFPEDTGEAVARVWQLTPGAEDDVVYAGTEPGAIFKSTDRGETFELERGLWDNPQRQEWNAGYGGPGVPHDPAPPRRPAAGAGGDLHRRRLPHRRRRRLVVPVQHRGEGRVHARGAQLPRVRPVRAQGDPPSRSPRPPLPAEPRRRLPLRRRRRHLAGHRAAGCRPSSASRSWSTPTTPRRCSRSRSSTPARAGRSTGHARVWRSTDGGSHWEPLGDGALPDDYYVAVMRDAMCVDSHETPGIYFGGRNGASGPHRTRVRPGPRSTRTCPMCAWCGPP